MPLHERFRIETLAGIMPWFLSLTAAFTVGFLAGTQLNGPTEGLATSIVGLGAAAFVFTFFQTAIQNAVWAAETRSYL